MVRHEVISIMQEEAHVRIVDVVIRLNTIVMRRI